MIFVKNIEEADRLNECYLESLQDWRATREGSKTTAYAVEIDGDVGTFEFTLEGSVETLVIDTPDYTYYDGPVIVDKVFTAKKL